MPLTATSGVGFVMSGGVEVDGWWLYSLDLDACRDPKTGKIEQWVLDVIAQCGNSYTEVTVSGTGLRVWVLLPTSAHRKNLPCCVVRVDAPPAANVRAGKMVELQVFGYGPPCYVTVTGEHLAGTSTEVARIDSLLPILESLGARMTWEDYQVPVGDGPAPHISEVELAVRRAPHGIALIDGLWRQVTPRDSASEAYWRLMQIVLRAAGGHGAVALDFLIEHTAWGRGEVEDCRDPERYMNRDRVALDLARCAGKTDAVLVATGAAFDDGFDAAAWQPPVEAPQAPQAPLALPLHLWLETVGHVEFLVPDLMPAQGLVQVIGKPTAGKSQVVLSLAMAIACGDDTWFGHPVLQQGSVLFLVGEGAPGFADRLRAECASRGINTSEVPIFCSVAPAELDTPKGMACWEAWVAANVPNLRMFVADTQTTNTSATFEENKAEDMKALMAHGMRLSERLRCVSVFVHHTGYENEKRGRGSSVQVGATDATFVVSSRQVETTLPEEQVTAEGDALEITIECTRAKDWPLPAVMVGSVRSFPAREGRTAPVLRQHGVQRVDVFPDGVEPEDVRLAEVLRDLDGKPVGRKRVAELSNLSEKVVRTKLADWVRRGLLVSTHVNFRVGTRYELTAQGVTAFLLAGPDTRASFEIDDMLS